MGVSLCYCAGGNGGFGGFGGNGDTDAVVFGQLEEGLDGDAVAVGVEAGGVLFVAFRLVVVLVKTAETVVVGTAVLAQGIGQGKAEVPPGGVAGGDVFAGFLDAAGDGFDIGLDAGGIGYDFRLGSGYIIGLIEPFAGIEGFLIHGWEGVQG